MKLEVYKTNAKHKATADGVPVFCAFDKIEKIETVKPNPQNPNKHPAAQIKLLSEIIKTTGWRAPITVSTLSGFIVKGHGRLMAAQLANLKEVPVDYQEYTNQSEELADLMADNRIAELAERDKKALMECFESFDTGEVPFILSGYTEEDYQELASMFDELPKEKIKEEDIECDCSMVCPNYGQKGCKKK